MKKIINLAVFAAVVAGTVVTAQAADITVNMYGASAQRDYWHSLGEDFLTKTTAEGGMGCASAHRAQADSNFRAIKGENCEYAGKTDPLQTEYDDVYITYGSVASLEGVKAAKEVLPIDATLSDTCANPAAQREIVNVSTCDFSNAWSTVGSCNATKVCADIHLGTSDVEGESFDQETHGNKFGHAGGTYVDIILTAEDTTGLVNYKPTVVPFAFYANTSIATVAPGVNDISRTEAINIFGGYVKNWNKLSGFTVSKGVQVCYRHAGSGTHATLDKAVFRGDDAIKKTQVSVSVPGIASNAWYYQSSSSTKTGEAGMQQCIETNGGRATGFMAMGYLDADAASSSMTQLKYQGASPATDEIVKGSYDFWSLQNVYLQTADDTDFVQDMMAYAAANIPADKVGIWVPAAALQVNKAKDTSIPTLK